MYFNRFDICEAHYLFAMEYHGGQWRELYEKFAQLNRIGFKPRPLLYSEEDLTENGKGIYRSLVEQWTFADTGRTIAWD